MTKAINRKEFFKATASPLESMLHAGHGLAYHVETVVDGQSHAFLFDFATDLQGVQKNIELLKRSIQTTSSPRIALVLRPSRRSAAGA